MVAQAHGQLEGQRFALLHCPVIERRNRIDNRQRFVELRQLQVQSGDLQPQVEILRASVVA